jgi:hypothetical protein
MLIDSFVVAEFVRLNLVTILSDPLAQRRLANTQVQGSVMMRLITG